MRRSQRIRSQRHGRSASSLEDSGVFRPVGRGTRPTRYVRTNAGNKKERKQRRRKLRHGINIATLNLRDGRAGRLALACDRLRRHHVGIAVVTETKLQGFHTTRASGFTIVATKAPSAHQGGVALVFKDDADWHVEDARPVGPNIVCGTIVHGMERTTIFGVYIPPSEVDLATTHALAEAMRGCDASRTIVVGDFNVALKKPRDERQERIVEELVALDVTDVADQFWARGGKRHWWTWRMFREGRAVSSLCDYVLGGSKVKWRRHNVVSVAFDTDHRMVTATLDGQRSRSYRRYLEVRRKPAVVLFGNATPVAEDRTRRNADGGRGNAAGGRGNAVRRNAVNGRRNAVRGNADGGRENAVSRNAAGGRGNAVGGRENAVSGNAAGGRGNAVRGDAAGGRVDATDGRATSVDEDEVATAARLKARVRDEQDERLQALHAAIAGPGVKRAEPNGWLSDVTKRLLSAKAAALRANQPTRAQELGRALRRNIRADRREWIRKVSVEVETRLEANDVIGAYALLRPWYRPFSGRAPVPSKEALATTQEAYVALFTADVIDAGLPFEFDYEGGPVNDDVPSEGEIAEALKRMRSRKAPGLTTIRVDHLKEWYGRSHPERDEDPVDATALERWEMVVRMVRECFETGVAPTAFQFGTLVIIPKDDKGGVRGIGLLEAIHKLISTIINLRMTESVEFCPAVHGFRRKRGCFTAIGEAKLRMQRAACTGETVYQVYLDLRKAYDSINRDGVIALMKKYGVGPRICRYVEAIWQDQSFLLK